MNGRMVRVIFVHTGAKVYPKALENAVSQIEGVQNAVFCEVPDKNHDGFACPVCFVVPEQNNMRDEVKESVRKFCEEFMPEYSRPKQIFVKEKLPLNVANKPDILALEKEAAAAMGE